MKTRTIFTKLSILLAAVALLATGVFWQVRRASAVAVQSDPPAFGVVSIVSSQAVRLNVVCSQHGINGFPPDPCRGMLMFHDTAGNDLQTQPYVLMPGQTMSLEQGFISGGGQIHMTINPCVIPAPNSRGRAIPSVEVFDMTTGKTELYASPIPRLSDLEAAQSGQP